jgi:hypothetical protein
MLRNCPPTALVVFLTRIASAQRVADASLRLLKFSHSMRAYHLLYQDTLPTFTMLRFDLMKYSARQSRDLSVPLTVHALLASCFGAASGVARI